MFIYVVTGLQLGWDCVVAAYDARKVTLAELELKYTIGEYVITEIYVLNAIGPEQWKFKLQATYT